MNQQLIICGVGGQGILFVTRLLAESAIAKGLPVLTSETHGMAQRGGIVVSHLKVGAFASPLVRPGRADALLSLKPETVALHLHFLKEGGAVAANAQQSLADVAGHPVSLIDADSLALALGDPQAVNLIVLGRALADSGTLFCTAEEVEAVIRRKMAGKDKQLARALAAFRAGLEAGGKEDGAC
ncbi:indolepyruvate oxidoreductase subunit beta [Geomonas sp. Red32]|uniref:indolepyruvate oxidoreductase subunit beta n=1 Tax=Geomonas sp. Red32 TaxID=2912856 RepID=UPI00202CBEB2|nr:indolepyruvate oxidoreductase subunit beta [Geomonas sp. Red32]MCM0083909.1 indolepyruvate oxidoreductase subunit beta [Geomonas sp. Red32]